MFFDCPVETTALRVPAHVRVICGALRKGEKVQMANQVSLGTNLEIIALCLVVLWLCYRSLKKRGIF